MKNEAIKELRRAAAKAWIDMGSYPHYSHKLGKLSQGFTIQQLKDGKPSTIKGAAICRAFIYYLIIEIKENKHDSGYWFNSGYYLARWNGEKATQCHTTTRGASADTLRTTWTNGDAEKLRKIGGAFYLVAVLPQFNEQDKAKQEQRNSNRPNPTTAERLKGCHELSGEENHQKGERFIFHYSPTWGNCEDIKKDASGYDLTNNRRHLAHRLREYKREKTAKEWNACDHSATVAELLNLAEQVKAQAVEIFAKSGEFYPLHMAEELRKAAQYIEETAEQVKNETTDAEKITQQIKNARTKAKKAAILAPLAFDPLAYGWNWWELTEGGELVNTYKNRKDREYYDKITAQSVGVFENQTQGATL